jgi:hypothetical protein
MPPTIEMWLAAPRLGLLVLVGNGQGFNGIMPYLVMPLEFIIGMAIIGDVLRLVRTTIKKA